jgi:ubiquinone/menaquinone biosynthesis C-methylase UbiE
MDKKPSTKLEYFESLALSGYKRNWFNGYYWNDISSYSDYFIHEHNTVLEIGCGKGDLLGKIKAKRKVGIDFSPSMIKQATEKFKDVEFHVMEAEKISLSEKFDLIIISNVVGYLDDIQSVFEELKKVCHENSRIIVTYYNSLWEPAIGIAKRLRLMTKSPALNWLTVKDINNLLSLSGFDVYRNSRRMIFPIYIPIVSTFLNKYIGKLPFFKFFSINNYSFAKLRSTTEKKEADKKYSVSVVIPARNESGNIENAILRLPDLGNHTEIIFIEGNSTDDTWEKIKEIQKKYEKTHTIKIDQQKGKGKADAVRLGFELATADILMILDADLTVPPEDLIKFYDTIASGKADFVNGSRLVYPMEKQAMRFLNLLGNRFFSLAFTWLLDQQFKDTLCGTKVIFRSDYKMLISNRSYFGDFDPFGDFDLIFGAHKLNLKIMEVPIRYRDRTYGSTNISRFKHGLILLRMCIFAARKIKFI